MTGARYWTKRPISISRSKLYEACKVRSAFKYNQRRWVVKRTFAWLMRYRRLVRDYEQRLDVSEAMLYISLGSSLLHRIRFR